jgi:chromate transporter
MINTMSEKNSKLFMIFFKIGAFTFGGGYSMIPLIEKEIVDVNEWMSKDEFEDSLALCQCAPGALAVNNAVLIGYKINGIKGAASAGIGVILPSFFVMIAIALIFNKIQSLKYIEPIFNGIRASVVGLILTAGIRLLTVTYFNIIIICVSFFGIAFFHINPFYIIIISAFLGIAKKYIGKAKNDIL